MAEDVYKRQFEGHPFRVVDDEEMMKTAESVRDFGVLTPAIVRPDVYKRQIYLIVSGGNSVF